MLYSFLLSLVDQYSFLNVFKYLTFRTGLSMITSMVIVFFIGSPLISFFSNQEITENIRKDGPDEHLIKKIGTPTMGGVMILIGILAGAVQGYFGGLIDLLGQRFLEIWSGIPVLYLIIIIGSIIIPSFWSLLFLLLLFSWMTLVGLVRAEFLKARNFDYVKAARCLGMTNGRIMFKHILPNAMVSTITFLPFIMAASITTLTSLDFLGFGLPPGSPSLGELLNQGKNNLHAPWLGITGFITISIMLTLLVFIGEAVRDAFDPRKINL